MKIVVGLGTPGEQYARTRHNIGWMVVDRVADRAGWAGRGRTRDASAVVQGMSSQWLAILTGGSFQALICVFRACHSASGIRGFTWGPAGISETSKPGAIF